MTYFNEEKCPPLLLKAKKKKKSAVQIIDAVEI
jgi:hypothetical protein